MQNHQALTKKQNESSTSKSKTSLKNLVESFSKMLLKHPAAIALPNFMSPIVKVPDNIISTEIMARIENEKAYLPLRLVSKRFNHIIARQSSLLLNSIEVQQDLQKLISSFNDEKALWDEQQEEIDCILKHEDEILTLVKGQESTQYALKKLKLLPKEIEPYSLYIRHKALNRVNIETLHYLMLHKKSCNILSWSNAFLTRIPNSFFLRKEIVAISQMVSLLDMENNFIKKLPNGMACFVNLRQLWMSNNRLQVLPDIFLKLKAIKLVRASHNCLASISDGLFSKSSSIEYLWLDNNQLTALPPVLCTLPKLRGLYLSNNYLTELPDNLNEVILRHFEQNACKKKTKEEILLCQKSVLPDTKMKI